MSTMTKFLALMPLVVLGAACGGSSPVGPSNPLASDEGFATAPDTSATAKDAQVDSCRDITGVNLEVLPATIGGVTVKATYVRFGGIAVRCAAPIWSSDPRGALITNQLNGFRVGVKPMRPVTVTAMAPNGVKGNVTLQGRDADLDASAVCPNVKGVKLTIVPMTNVPNLLIQASYMTLGPSMSNCPAPVWSSDPRGALSSTKDPFRVSASAIRPLTVTATAPNGLKGTLTLHASDLETSAAACKQVTGVQVKVVPSTLPGATLLEAKYLQFGPSLGNCPAPAWSSDPRGILSATKDPFRVRVSSVRPATVTATAPSGIRGEITLQK